MESDRPSLPDSAEMPPGTELMRNTTHHHLAETQGSHQVLIPTPSNDPADPLNWSTKWKLIVIFNQASYVLFSIIPALSIAPVTPIFIAEFQTTPATVSLFLGVCVIVLGYANFIIIPFSNIFGRRAACLITGAIVIGSNIWQATAKDTGSFFGARALNGLGGAVNESVMVQVIADMFFLHERGQWMGLYFASYFIGLFIGPIIAGNMAEYVGWRNFFWLCTAVSATNFILLLFLFPETKFHRPGPERYAGEFAEKGIFPSSTGGVTPPEEQKGNGEAAHLDVGEDLGAKLGQGKPGKKQWLLIQKPYPGAFNSLARDFLTPIYIISFPIVFWAAIVVGGAANTLLVMNLTQSGVFSAPPYNFSPGNVGFVNFAFLAGGVFSLITAGPFSDWVAKKLTIRNNDLREPEMRMVAIIPYCIIMLLGCIIVGCGYRNRWPWEAVIIFGYTCIGIQVIALPTIAVAYAVDSYKPISGEILVICTVFKNTFGFGMSWWVPELTPLQSVMVLFACTSAACLVGVPIYFFGKRLRTITKDNKVHGFESIM